MSLSSEVFWVALGGVIIAALCLIAAGIIAYRDARRKGQSFRSMISIEPGARFTAILIVVVIFRPYVSSPVMHKLPFALIWPGVEISAFAGTIASAVLVLKLSADKNWRLSWIGYQGIYLLVVLFFAHFVYDDIVVYRSMPWVWLVGGAEAAFLIPIFMRFVYLTDIASRVTHPPAESSPDDRPRISHPREPM